MDDRDDPFAPRPRTNVVRYDFRDDGEAGWTVFDVFTGQPALVMGEPATGLDGDTAVEWTDTLNFIAHQEARKNGTLPG